MRERRRQFGLPLPIADKVLPFRPPTDDAGVIASYPTGHAAGEEGRLVEAWEQLADAERRGARPRLLRSVERAYLRELAAWPATSAASAVRAPFGCGAAHAARAIAQHEGLPTPPQSPRASC